MANGGDLPAGASIEEESPVVPPPPPREISTANNPPPRLNAQNRVNLTEENQSLLNSLRSTTLTPQETDACMHSLFNLMTSSEDQEGAAQFREVVSRLDEDGSDLRRMASLLTSDYDRFLEMARSEKGSNRAQELLGKSDDVDRFFFNAILRRFVHIMTDWNASRVGMRGMRVFSQAKKTEMYEYVIHHALHLACHRDGFVVLKQIIDDWSGLGLFLYRDQLCYVVAQNALSLSYDAYGNYVVQHVLRLNDLRCTHNIGVSLSGHCVYLSFTKFGSYIVEKLLDREEVMVVGDLLRCDGEMLSKLARNVYGNYVVEKTLRVMLERNRMDLFWGLVNKLMPFVHLLRGVHGRNIGAFLDSLY